MYDIADLHKAEISIPVAFGTAAACPEDIGSATRRNMRDALYDLSIMKRMLSDITALLSLDDDKDEGLVDELKLWDDKSGEVAAGKLYLDEREG